MLIDTYVYVKIDPNLTILCFAFPPPNLHTCSLLYKLSQIQATRLNYGIN